MRLPGLVRCTALAASLAATGCATFDIGETHFFHPGPAATSAPRTIGGAVVEDVTLRADDGTALGGVSIRQADADVEVLYFGGNASRADDMAAALARIVDGLRVNVLMIDYRGYGRSAGTPAIQTVKQDAVAAFDSLRGRAGGRPIVVHGVSLGGFVAAHVAASRTAEGLVLEATAPDVQTWARSQIPAYARPFVRLKIAPALLAESNVEAVRRHRGPLLLLTGSRDTVTPPRFMEPLLAASPSPARRAVVAEGAGHGGALAVPEARQAYAEFLDGVRSRRGSEGATAGADAVWAVAVEATEVVAAGTFRGAPRTTAVEVPR